MYEIYDEFYRLATNPSGSYQSYSNDVHEVASKFANVFGKLDILISDTDKDE